jgi:toxin ParE1/3/4
VGRIDFRPKALGDLDDIWDHVAPENMQAAERLLDAIEAKLELLAERPLLGRARPELGADLRSFAHRPYLIFYRPLADGIEVLRVLHGARELGPLLDEEA